MESTQQSIYDYAGGEAGLRRIVEIFYNSIFFDPVLLPVFKHPVASHIDHLTAFLGEEFGGPKRYSEKFGGFPAIVAVHRGLKIKPEQRERFIDLFMAAIDKAGFAGHPRFIATIRSAIEFGTEVALVNSNAQADNELHPLNAIPKWRWEKA
jgi:hemoglobin